MLGVLEIVGTLFATAAAGWLVGEGLAGGWKAMKNALKTMKDSFSFAPALDGAIKNILWPEAA